MVGRDAVGSIAVHDGAVRRTAGTRMEGVGMSARRAMQPVEFEVDGLTVRLSRKRVKNLNLRVPRGGGLVEVSAPAYMRTADVERFVREKRSWIDAKLAQAATSPAGSSPSDSSYCGRQACPPSRP